MQSDSFSSAGFRLRFPLFDRRTLLTAVVLGLLVFVAAWAGIRLTRENDRIAAVWLANGLVAGLLLKRPAREWLPILTAAAVGNVAANLVNGDSLPFALALTCANQLEILLVARLTGPAFAIHQRIEHWLVIKRLLLATSLACATSATLASLFLWATVDAPLFAVGANWFLSDALGMATVVPIVTATLTKDPAAVTDYRRVLVTSLLAVALSYVVMFRQPGQPLLFTLAPIVFYAALRLSLRSALLLVSIVSSIALAATLNGHGIIAAANPDPTARMYLFQLFVAVQLFTVLPVRALIGERDRLGQAAAESDRLFRRIAEASPAGIIHFDVEGRATFVNSRWTELTGATFDDLQQDGWLGTFERSYLPAARSLWSTARATDRPATQEFPYLKQGRSAGWAELNIYPEIEHHRLLGYVARLTDVTARRDAEAAIAESEALYRLVTENAHDVVFRLTASGRIEYVSTAIERRFGMTPQRLVGTFFSSIVEPDDRDAVSAILAADRSVSDPVVQFRLRGDDGAVTWVEASYNLFASTEFGKPEEIVVSLRDVDRRRQDEIRVQQASAKVIERNRLLHMAEDLAEIGHWRYDLESGTLDCSPKALNLACAPSNGTPVSPLDMMARVISEDRTKLLRALALVRKTGSVQCGPIRIDAGSGRRYLRLGAQTDVDRDGKVTGIFGILRDKTEYVVAQEALIEARDQAQAAAMAKSHFLATMSHEIRTPMTGVLGMIDLLRDESDADARERYFATLKQSADLLMAVVDDVLDFSKIDSGALRLDRTDFDLKELAASTVDLFGNAASRKGLLLTLDTRAAADPVVNGDPVRIQQVVSNLLSNAIKFTPHGRVRVSLGCDQLSVGTRQWTIRVADTGIGIAEEEVGKLFQPFVQADDSSARRFGGTGLGLAISRRLVEAMGGEIGVETKAGMGSTFWVKLPLEDAASDALPTTRPGWSSEPALPSAGSLSLLVAEDNPVNQMLIGALLKKMGHRVDLVDNGRAAVEAAAARRYDAILMDMQMPEMDGLAATRTIRASGGAWAEIPIIALTADASPERKRFNQGVGLTDFMTKPIDQAELAAKLASIREGGEGPPVAASDRLP